MIEGAPCSLDVNTETSILTFNVNGERQRYNVTNDRQQLFKEIEDDEK